MTKYRLHRYFYSSCPVIPLIATVCFLGSMYSVKTMDVCSGFILSGIFQFIMLTFVALSMNGKEEVVENFLKFLCILLPSVMKPARDLGNGDYFEVRSVIAFLIMMVVYYFVVVVIKNLGLKEFD